MVVFRDKHSRQHFATSQKFVSEEKSSTPTGLPCSCSPKANAIQSRVVNRAIVLVLSSDVVSHEDGTGIVKLC